MARGDVATIELCAGCRVVSLHLGATTVRMDPEACASLWSTLGQALAGLCREGVVNEPRADGERPVEPARFHS